MKAPQAKRIDGPIMIRSLLNASNVYRQTVTDTLDAIQIAVQDGSLREQESAYAELLMNLGGVAVVVGWTAEKCRVLLGESGT